MFIYFTNPTIIITILYHVLCQYNIERTEIFSYEAMIAVNTETTNNLLRKEVKSNNTLY